MLRASVERIGAVKYGLRSLFQRAPELKSMREIGLMREAGKIVSEALGLCRSLIATNRWHPARNYTHVQAVAKHHHYFTGRIG